MRGLSNGLYIVNRDAVAYLDGPLTPGSVIQLDRTDYVAPDPALAPIVVGEATPEYPLLEESDAAAFRKPTSGFDGWRIILSDDRTQVLLVPDPRQRHTITYHGNGASGPPARCLPLLQAICAAVCMRKYRCGEDYYKRNKVS